MSSILETRVEAKIVWRLVKISDTKIWLIMTKAKYYQDDEWRPRKKRRVVALGDCERAHANWRHMAHQWCTLWGLGTSVETVETNVQVWKLWKCELPTCSPHFSGKQPFKDWTCNAGQTVKHWTCRAKTAQGSKSNCWTGARPLKHEQQLKSTLISLLNNLTCAIWQLVRPCGEKPGQPGSSEASRLPNLAIECDPNLRINSLPTLWHLDSAADLVKVDQLASHAPFVQLAQIAKLAQVNQLS